MSIDVLKVSLKIPRQFVHVLQRILHTLCWLLVAIPLIVVSVLNLNQIIFRLSTIWISYWVNNPIDLRLLLQIYLVHFWIILRIGLLAFNSQWLIFLFLYFLFRYTFFIYLWTIIFLFRLSRLWIVITWCLIILIINTMLWFWLFAITIVYVITRFLLFHLVHLNSQFLCLFK
jgi:hypothetical protein